MSDPENSGPGTGTRDTQYFNNGKKNFFFSCLLVLYIISPDPYSVNLMSQINLNTFQEPLKLSCINCNSLNMSNSAKWNQTLKICGITKLKSDIIFLSDIRLSNRNLVSSAMDIKKLFLNNPYKKYDFYYNSSKNKRGVGILLKTNKNIRVLAQFNSADENILLLHLGLQDTEVIAISIYGPNTADPVFFESLTE
jgi:hypothetical protein